LDIASDPAVFACGSEGGKTMTLKIAQSAHPHENRPNYWKWRVWLEGTDEELDQVRSVTYQLHSTFRNPTREVSDRNSKFAIKSAGWGEFTIYALVRFLNGKEVPMNHWLRLDETTARNPQPLRIFLSYNFSDSHIAQPIAKALVDLGVQVSDSSAVKPGSSWPSALTKLIEEADVAVLLIGKSFSGSTWSDWEIRELQDHDVGILPVVMDDTIPNSFLEARSFAAPIRVKRSDDPMKSAQAIIQMMPKLLPDRGLSDQHQ
jgi:hypothetical protein